VKTPAPPGSRRPNSWWLERPPLARLTSGIVCDFAQVREGLLFVSSGAITRVFRPSLPAALGVMLAMVVEVPADEHDQTHEVRVAVRRNATAERIFEWVAGFQMANVVAEPGESIYLPLVAAEMARAAVPAYGSYDIRMNVDGNEGPYLTAYVVEKPLVPGSDAASPPNP
jgi:Family of unknown function (DUF6941)